MWFMIPDFWTKLPDSRPILEVMKKEDQILLISSNKMLEKLELLDQILPLLNNKKVF